MGVQSLFLLNLKVVEPSALRWMAGKGMRLTGGG